jgi:hypothetical protein
MIEWSIRHTSLTAYHYYTSFQTFFVFFRGFFGFLRFFLFGFVVYCMYVDWHKHMTRIFFYLFFLIRCCAMVFPFLFIFLIFFIFFWNFVFLFSCSSLLNPFAQCLLYVYKFGPIERNIKTVQWIHNFLLVSTQGNKTPLPTTLIKSQYLFLAIMFDAVYATQLSDSSTRSTKIIPRAL